MNPALIALLIQESPVLVEDIIALFRKHPALTPETLSAVAGQVYSTNADTRSTVVADQKAHPIAPVVPITPITPAP